MATVIVAGVWQFADGVWSMVAVAAGAMNTLEVVAAGGARTVLPRPPGGQVQAAGTGDA